MIAHVTGGKILPQEIADQISDRTDCVPLFIEELTKTVGRERATRRSGGSICGDGSGCSAGDPTSLWGWRKYALPEPSQAPRAYS
jgi:hypothetical protein